MKLLPRQWRSSIENTVLVGLLLWTFNLQSHISAEDTEQGLKGEKGEPGSPGKDGKDCIPPLPQPGSPVHVGGGKYKILEGAEGPSGSSPVNTVFGGKGAKGDMGEPGPAGPVGPPGVCQSSECSGPRGSCMISRDCIGPKGEPGYPGEKGDQGQRGPRGSPGIDGRGIDRILNYGYGAIIVETVNDLEAIADYMPGGSMVLVRRGTSYGPELHMKVAYPENLWRQIALGFGSEISYRKLSPPPQPYMKVARFRNSAPMKTSNQKLVLAVLEEPLRGNLQARVASYKCNERAKEVGLPGLFQPFLDSVAQRLEFTVPEKYAHLAIVNARGEYLFKNWSSIFQGEKRRSSADLLTFSKLNVLQMESWRPKYLWVGTNSQDSGDNEVSCRDWTSSKPLDFGMGLDLKSDAFLKELKPLPCGNAYYVACIQVTPN